jgi:phage portal protein BeeE
MSDNNTVFFGLDSNAEIERALTECPQVAFILLKKAQAYANGEIKLLKSSKREVNEQDSLYKLIKTPNIIQSDIQFRTQLYYYMMAYGYCPVLRVESVGFGLQSLWIIPPSQLTVEFIDELPYYKTDISQLVTKTTLKAGSKQWELDKNSIYFFTDTTGWNTKGFLPMSRLVPLKYPINNLIKNYKSRARIIEKPYGILTNQARDNISSIPIDPREKKAVQEALSQYGTGDGQYDTIVTNAPLQWQQMMYPIQQLQLLEMQDKDTQVIADTLGVPYDLLGSSRNSTFNNKDQSGTDMYQDHIIPDAKNIDQQFDECLGLIGTGRTIHTSYEHVASLQADHQREALTRETMGRALIQEYEAGIISRERVRELLGEIGADNGTFYVENTNDGKETNEEGNGGNQGQESQSDQGQEND